MAAILNLGESQQEQIFSLALSLVFLIAHVVNAKHSAHSYSRVDQPINTEPTVSGFESVEIQNPVKVLSTSSSKSLKSGLPLDSETVGYGASRGCASRVEHILKVLCKGDIPILQEDDKCCLKSCSSEELAKYCGRKYGSQRPKSDMAVTFGDSVATDDDMHLEVEVSPGSKNKVANPFSILYWLLNLLFPSPDSSQKENGTERNLVEKPVPACSRMIKECGKRLRDAMKTECNMIYSNPNTKRMGLGSLLMGQVGKRATSTGKTFMPRRVRRALVDDCCYKSCCVEDLRLKYCGSQGSAPIPEPVPALMKLFNGIEEEHDLTSPQPRNEDSLSSNEGEGSDGEFESHEDGSYSGRSFENTSGSGDGYDEEE